MGDSSTGRAYDVFVSHAKADADWVRRLAENLHHAGLEVFFDEWEIDYGDVVSRELDRGLAHARNGILVVSPTSLSRPWVQEEYAALLNKAVASGGRLIPVLLKDAEMPPMLATRRWVDFRGADGPVYEARVRELVAALKGERPGPPPREPGALKPPPGTGYRAEAPLERTLVIRRETVTLRGGQAEVTAPVGPAPGDLDHQIWQLERELRGQGEPLREPISPTETTTAEAARLHARQLEVGRGLARWFLPDPVGAALMEAVAEAGRLGASLALGLEVAEELASLPWEALCLPGDLGEPLALHPRLRLFRRVAGLGPTPAHAIPGPLRILVAIGSPEAQNARGELLDMERELEKILDAVEPARKAGRAHVRILERGTLGAIRQALEAERYHVLHLSCHAGPGVLVLEDEGGGEERVSAARLWREALPADRGVPLVVLAGCSTARDGATQAGAAEGGEKELPGLARGLLAAGVPAVLAMRAPVGDRYATELAAAFYGHLATAAEPLPLAALATARVGLEAARGQAAGAASRPEWSTPLLLLRGEGPSALGLPLYDPQAPFARVEPPHTVRLAQGVVVREVGDFVGRRRDQRLLLAALRGDRHSGVLIRGLGGVGKSTLSAQLAGRLGEERFLVVSRFGETGPEAILEELGARLTGAALAAGAPEGHPLRKLAQFARQRDREPAERFEVLAEHVLGQIPVLLLLDNFEDNLTPIEEGAGFKSAALETFLAGWLERPGASRLLFTCRYPIPLSAAAAEAVFDLHLGPLSFAETRKLFWRLPSLEARTQAEQQEAWLTVGGHPRALEYLDALLAGGKARFGDVTARLEREIRQDPSVRDPRAWLKEKGARFDTALVETVARAAGDVLLADLLGRLEGVPLAQRLLVGAAVFRMPVEEAALVWQVGEAPGLPRDPEPDPLPVVAAPEGYEEAKAKLEELGLLTPFAVMDGPELFTVHRWTARQVLGRADEGAVREAHRRAALYWRWRVAKAPQSREQDVADCLEAREHHWGAGEEEEAYLAHGWACSQLETWGADRQEEELIHQFLARLGPGSPRGAAHLHHLGILAQQRGDYDQALDWYRKSLEIEEQLGNRAGMAGSYHQLGTVAQDRGDYDQAIDWYRKSLEIDEQLGNHAGMASSYHQLGNVGYLRGDYDQALDWYRKSLEIFEQLGNRVGMASSYHQLGVVAQRRGDYDQALDWYRKSLEIFEQLGNRAGMATCYHQLGMVAQDRGDYDQALDWCRKSLEIDEQLGNRAGMASSYHQLGRVAQDRGDYDQALDWYRASLEIEEQLGNRAGMASSYHQLGMVAQDRGDYDQALDWYRKSLEIKEQLGNRAGMAISYGQMGVLEMVRGHSAEAVAWTVRSLAIHSRIQSPNASRDLHWLSRQRETLGEDRFREVLARHLDEERVVAVLGLIDQYEAAQKKPE
ncbi:MAG TPA: tetratricopeptide repeat protein [Thermoanaerobaculia bacterium]|nr:tetratricopeptide repeat protein [Thermoanaerobaculia bacterium]